MMASAVATGNRRKSLTLRGVDPETCMIVFKNHWTQVVRILEKHEPGGGRGGGGGGGVLGSVSFGFLSSGVRSAAGGGCSSAPRPVPPPIPADEASAVQNYVEHMLFLLMEEEAGPGGAMGPILELVVVEGVMERLFLWSLRRQFTEELKVEQLRMYQMLLGQARQPLLHHKAVLRPLMTLLASCASTTAASTTAATTAGPNTAGGGGVVVVEAELVSLLKQLSVSLVRDPSVLELFFHTSEDQGSTNFLLFSLLIPYTHRQGTIGQQARESLLLIMSLSATEHRVAQHITGHTYFCPVLATGLSGLYSSLPAKLQVYSEDWFRLEREDWTQVPALVDFLNSLDFCNTVIKVAHPSIRSQLLGYIYNGFLVPVLAPALHKVTVEEVMTSTAYLELFLRCVSEPALLHAFLSFVLVHAHDNVHILDTLVSRVNTPFQLGTVSLSLFSTLIGLFCEDVVLQLVLRYLIPCDHLGARQQRSSLAQRDVHSSCASSLLRLMPSWCPHDTHARTAQHIHWPRGADADSVGFSQGCEFPMDVNYLHYLWDARLAVSTANRACLTWSAPYDGFSPSPSRGDEEEEEEDGEEDERGGGREDAGEETRRRRRRRRRAQSPPSTPSSLCSAESVAGGNNQHLQEAEEELEWDDMAAVVDAEETNAQSAAATAAAAPLRAPPPRHIQAMRRSVSALLVSGGGGAYSEDTDFLCDRASTCGLVSTRDQVPRSHEAAAILNADRRDRHHRASAQCQHDAPANGRRSTPSVLEAVSSIMSTRRREERRRGEGERKGDEDEESLRSDAPSGRVGAQTQSPPRTHHHRLHSSTHAKRTADSRAAERETPRDPSSSFAETNGVADSPPVPAADDFLSQYRALMMSLGVEPEGDDDDDDDIVADGMAAFRRRVRALMERLEEEEEEEGLGQEVDFHGGREWEELCGGGEDGERGGEERRRGSQGRVPFTGPFLSVLLSRLENLLENSISVNLLLTGLLAQLASYPQPLLKGFLLDTRCQPNVRTLYQVLRSVHVQIEQYVSSRPEWPAVITQAWRFLLAKDQHMKIRELLQSPPGDDDDSSSTAEPGIPAAASHHGCRTTTAAAEDGSVLPPSCPPPPAAAPLLHLPPCPPIPPQARSRVFAVVLYAEFLKELAAVAQEHSVVAAATAAPPPTTRSGVKSGSVVLGD